MSFRRRKSRIGPGFQAVIPVILSKKQKEELQKLYDYEQSLSEHCLTLSQLSSPIISISNMNNNPNNSKNSNANTTNTNIQQPQQRQHHSHNTRPFTINDISIDHLVEPICFEISKSYPQQHFNYANYVKQMQLFPHKALQQKLDKLHHDNNINNNNGNMSQMNDKKRKREKDIIPATNTNNNSNIAPPSKKQKIGHISPPNTNTMPPLPIPPIPLNTNNSNVSHSQMPLLTPSPPHSAIHKLPHIPPLPININNLSNQTQSDHSFTNKTNPNIILNNQKIENGKVKIAKKKKSKRKSKSKSKSKKKEKKKRDKQSKSCEKNKNKNTDSDNRLSNEIKSSETDKKQSNKSTYPHSNASNTPNTKQSPPPIPLNTNTAMPRIQIQPQPQPPPPTFLPLQTPTATVTAMPHHPLPAVASPYPYVPVPVPVPGAAMSHLGNTVPPYNISYTHYNPQFYYMHTTYTYGPTKPTKKLNPKIIKKQHINNKSCEVIDLCDEDNASVVTQTHSAYQYPPPPNYSTMPGMPQFTLPPPPPMVLTSQNNPFGIHIPVITKASDDNHKKNGLITPINTRNLNNSSVASSDTQCSLTTPTNIDVKEDILSAKINPKKETKPLKSLKNKKKIKLKQKDGKNIKNETRNVVNNKINIKSKHVGLFESLLTPKTASNSANNSNIINRVLQQQPSRSSTQYQKLETMTPNSKKSKKKKHGKSLKTIQKSKNAPKMVSIPMVNAGAHQLLLSNNTPLPYPIHAFHPNMAPFPLMHGPPHMIPMSAPMPIHPMVNMQHAAHLRPMMLPSNDMTMPAIGGMPHPHPQPHGPPLTMTPFVLTSSNAKAIHREYSNKEVDRLWTELCHDLDYKHIAIATPQAILNLNKRMAVDQVGEPQFDTKSFHSDVFEDDTSESDSDSDSDFSPSEMYKNRKKKKRKHRKKKRKRKKKKKKKKSSRVIVKKIRKKIVEDNGGESVSGADEKKEKLKRVKGETLFPDINGMADNNNNSNSLFGTFNAINASPSDHNIHSTPFEMDNSYNIDRSASPPFNLSDDLYGVGCGSLQFRSPQFGSTAFYENGSPLMPVDIDRHSPPPNYS